jgi:PAS domain S-box-containing protein
VHPVEVTPPSSARDDELEEPTDLTANQQFHSEAAAVAAETAAKLEAANLSKKNDLAAIEKKFFFASLCCLGLIFVISLISTVTVHSTVKGISTESTTQAIAARQRMLAQQIAKSSGAIAVHAAFPDEMGTLADLRLELETAEKEFEKQHVMLRNDKMINSARVAQEFQDVDAAYQIIKTKAISIISLVPTVLTEIALQSDRDTVALYAASCMKAVNDFAPQMDTIAKHVQEEHDATLVSSLDDLVHVTWAMLGAVFLAVCFEAVKVFKPMLARVALFASVALDSQVAVQATENDLSHKRNIARLFETASAPIFAIDNDYNVTSWNPQMAKITGMPEEEAIGQQLISLVPESATDTVKKLSTISMEGGEAGLVELPVLNQNGAPKMLVVSASAQRDMGSSKIEGLFCIAQDFTEHKAMEKARDTFLASFSHEIRTPLNGVLGMLQVLCEFDLPGQAMTYLRQACTSGNLLLNLINDILDLSKINAGQLEMSEAPFDISQTVKDAMSIVRPIATKKDISLMCHIADAVPDVGIGDAMRLRQVILNLLSNAIKFTPEGAVTLRVGLHDVRDGKYVLRFEVEDTGVGMTTEGMAGLFQIFGKLKQTQVANTSGCGLGLSISKQLVALMGGDIEVSSVVGKGSKFSFTIAVERHDVKKSGSDSDTASKSTTEAGSGTGSGTGTGTGSGSGTHDLAQQLGDGLSTAKYKESLKACSTAHLLCAEDNLFNVEVLRAFVSGSSMTMTCVENGKLAYEAYISDPLSFDVILMDCQMPEMDGYEATQLIRQWERTHEKKLARRAAVPIVALTAYAMSLDRKKALDAGMDSFLTKPVSKYALIHTISEHVAGKVSRKASSQSKKASKAKAEKLEKMKQKEDKSKLVKLEMLHASVLPRDVLVAERAADTKTRNDIDDRSLVTDSVTNASSNTAVRRAKAKTKADWKSLPIVDQQAGLMQFGGSQQAHMEILDMFAKTFLPACRSDIARHRADKNYSALSKTVHSLKGASGFAVASRIFALAKDLQRIVPGTEKLSEGEEGAVTRLLERLDDEFDKFMAHYTTINGTPMAAQRALATRSTLKSPDERRLDSVVVRYAEDNPFCVSVIRTYMQSCNATIVPANDGTDVVSKLVSARDKYDCVLMDCHMPVMDGFQALKVIRQWEGDQDLEPIPIVGITAYAGHRDTMLEGGMTGFLTKPVRRPTLIRTIAACLDGRKAEQESETESVYDTADAAELGVLPEEGSGGGAEGAENEGSGETASFVADLPVDMKAGTANFGSEDQYLDLLQRFRSSFIPEATASIQAALKARDSDALSKAVHRLKGSAGYVGAGALFQVCSETRTAIMAKGASWEKSERQATAVLAEVKRVLAFLERNDKVRAFFDADQKGAGAVAKGGDDVSQDGSLSSLEMC